MIGRTIYNLKLTASVDRKQAIEVLSSHYEIVGLDLNLEASSLAALLPVTKNIFTKKTYLFNTDVNFFINSALEATKDHADLRRRFGPFTLQGLQKHLFPYDRKWNEKIYYVYVVGDDSKKDFIPIEDFVGKDGNKAFKFVIRSISKGVVFKPYPGLPITDVGTIPFGGWF